MRKTNRKDLADPFPQLKMLPMFYLFPQELLDCSNFSDFPRNPYTVLESPKWMAIYNSLHFMETVSDGMANMVWKHFGIKASMETFSGYYPFWMLARLGAWIAIAEEFGFNTYSLGTASKNFAIPVLSWEQAESYFAQFVEIFRQRYPLDKWIEVVKQHPCHEDYEPSRWSKGRIDFYRKWYHSRSITKVSFVGETWEWERLKSDLFDPWNSIDFKLDYENFKQTLSEKDRKVIELLYSGYTQVEIAKILGYANHSAVSKRAAKIAKNYRTYMEISDEPVIAEKPAKDNWDEMTNLLFPKIKSNR
ncbi:hypothetical protein LJC61_08265 [Ruminococcaceae bacterium OttesenSCG-928-A16]|nr:hypothetical protein [Ruminococcaceae bacterium OttesenSCG-928-A16]